VTPQNPPDETDSTNADESTGELEPVEAPLFGSGAVHRSAGSGRVGTLTKLIGLGVIAILVLVVLAANPGNVLQIEELAAFALAIFGAIELYTALRDQSGYRGYIQPVAAIAVGIVIWVWPEETLAVVGLLLGALVIVRGLTDVWSAIRRLHETGANTWVFVRGLILIGIGGLILLFPHAAVPFAVVGGAAIVIARAIIALSFVMTGDDDEPDIPLDDTFAILTHWLSAHEMTEEQVDHVEQVVFLHRGNTKERVFRFGILMALSTAIATFGIAVDSTAVVIGAMLVAPLMTPILGLSAGLINGRRRAAWTSGVIVAGGAAGAVALAWALSALIPNITAVVANSQVTTRTAPSLLDLAIAIAAGIAGAYSVSRAESSDALPGVAVAIALVPPLSVVGITLHAGDVTQAAGATLLFLTNLFSILLLAGVVFLAVGYGSWTRLYHRRNRIRTAFSVVALAVVLITIPLALTGQSLIRQASDLRHASEAVNDWLTDAFPGEQDPPLRINTIEFEDDVLNVQLIGHETPPPSLDLAWIASKSIGRPVSASVRWIVERLEIGTPTPLPAQP